MTASTLTPDRKAFLHTVFVTALEGGIGYWSAASHYHWRKDGEFSDFDDSCDVDGFYAIIEPPTSEGCWGFFAGRDDRSLRIDARVITLGIDRFVEKYTPILANQPDDYWHQFFEANRTNGDEGDCDADVADAVVQLGLFGEIVYA